MNNSDERSLAEEMAVRVVLADTDLVFEALSVGGITYDFPTRMLRMSPAERKDCSERMGSTDRAIADQYAYHISVNDYEAIGRMVVDQVNGYLGHRFEEVAEQITADMENGDQERKDRMES